MKNRIVVIGVIVALFSINCASNKNQKPPTVDMEGVEQQQPISVGSVEVKLELIQFVDEKARVEVVEVMGYGASTDRLAPSQTLEIGVHETLTNSISEMEAGTVFDAVLSMQRAGIGESNSWIIKEILDR
jgi:hypothetical protein